MAETAPLNALRAFEAAARTGSFTNAALELGVSSAAVSQQVKVLEEFWRETLFIRQGNRIFLTEAGQTAYPQLAQAMDALATLSLKMQRKASHKRRLTLSAPQSVAETWLAPLLARAPKPLSLNIRVDEDPVDWATENIHMRIFYGHDLYGEYQTETLFSDQIVAVANPQFVERHGKVLDELGDSAFIHTDWGRGFASSPDIVFALETNRVIDRTKGLQVQSSSTALNMARHGLGVALVPAKMAQSDIALGAVQEMNYRSVASTYSYQMAFPKRLKSNRTVLAVLAALQNPDELARFSP